MQGALGFDLKEWAPAASRGLSWLASLKIRLNQINARNSVETREIALLA